MFYLCRNVCFKMRIIFSTHTFYICLLLSAVFLLFVDKVISRSEIQCLSQESAKIGPKTMLVRPSQNMRVRCCPLVFSATSKYAV